MNTKSKIGSFCITFVIAGLFIAAASLFAINYNSWFVDDSELLQQQVSAADFSSGLININMKMSEPQKEDGESADQNIYGFPTSDKPYFIYVEKGGHTLSVFSKDKNGFYTVLVATWSTATGKSAGQTPTGVFTLGKREEWHVWPANSLSPYSTTYYEVENHYGGLFIHGPIYRRMSFDSVFPISVSNIGKNVSSGCLRTEVEAAYFVYEMCEAGTQVKIVEGSPLGLRPYRKVTIQNQLKAPNLKHFSLASVTPDKIEFTVEAHSMTVGEEYVPEMVVTPSYAGDLNGVWSTNNPSAVKIYGNIIRAVGTGSAIVSYTTFDGNVSASLLINTIVGNVNTAAAPPKVDGGTTVDNSNIGSDYKPISNELIYLNIKGSKFSINEKANNLLKLLGSKYYMTKAQSCAYQGEDKLFTYTFKSKGKCQISTVPLLDGEDTICEVSINNYLPYELESSKGIKIGNELADIEREYGKYYTQEYIQASGQSDAYTRIIYWAGEPNKPGVPYLYFILDSEGKNVTGMGIFSARNIG